MENKRIKKISILLVFVLIVGMINYRISQVRADNSTTLKILEIEPGDKFALSQTNFDSGTFSSVDSNFNDVITTSSSSGTSYTLKVRHMSMPEFIGNIDQINGKYDVVFIGNEYYSQTINNIPQTYKYSYLTDAQPQYLPQGKDASGGLFNGTDSQEYYGENDITNKRAGHLLSFINSGQLTVIDKTVVDGTTVNSKTKLYTNLNPIKSKTNVKLTETAANTIASSSSNIASFAQQIANWYSDNNLSKRPTITFTSNGMPAAGIVNGVLSTPLTNRNMQFIFNIAYNPNVTLKAKLYLDTNGDGIFADPIVNSTLKSEIATTVDNIQLSSTGIANQVSLNYRVPDNYTGLIPWKLEVEQTSGLSNGAVGVKSYTTGNVYFRAGTINLRVLQLTPNSGTNFHLKDISQNLLNTSDYNITFDEHTVDWYQNQYPHKDSNGVPILNGYYDMIIMGFQDNYGGSDITDANAIKGLKNFIATGQSLMMTHDTLTYHVKSDLVPGSSNAPYSLNITRTFRDLIGQARFLDSYNTSATDLFNKNIPHDGDITSSLNGKRTFGFALPILKQYATSSSNSSFITTTTTTNKINDGIITQYPYVIGKSLSVNATHPQYFQLNLEDDNVVPWFTLDYNNSSDNTAKGTYYNGKYDPRNYYYTYSKGNITYSGTGHTGPGSDETNLFINTIVKAARGANHAPTLDVYNLSNNMQVSRLQNNIAFNFVGTDLDNDKMTGKIYIEDSAGNVLNTLDSSTAGLGMPTSINSTVPVNITIPKSSLNNVTGSTFKIKVILQDSQGADSNACEYTLQYATTPTLVFTSRNDKTDGYLVGDNARVTVTATATPGNASGASSISNASFDITPVRDSNNQLVYGYDSSKVTYNDSGTKWSLTGANNSNVAFNFQSSSSSTQTQSRDFNFTVKQVGTTNINIDSKVNYNASYMNGGQNNTVTMPDSKSTITIPVRSSTLTVKALNSNSGVLGYSQKFRITKPDGSTVDDQTDASTGQRIINGLPSGNYRVQLLDVPSNYELQGTTDTRTVSLSYSNYQQSVDFTLNSVTAPNLSATSSINGGYLVGDTATLTANVTPDKGTITQTATINNASYTINSSNSQGITISSPTWSLNSVSFGPDPNPSAPQTHNFNINTTKAGDYTINSNLSYNLNMNNENYAQNPTVGSVTLHVRDGQIPVTIVDENSRPLSVATQFTVTKSDNTYTSSSTVNANSSSNTANGLSTGTYNLTITIPDSYELQQSSRTQTVSLSYDNNSAPVTFTLKHIDRPSLDLSLVNDKNGYLVGDTAKVTATATASQGTITKTGTINNAVYSIANDYDKTAIGYTGGNLNYDNVTFSPAPTPQTQQKIMNFALNKAGNYTINGSFTYNLTMSNSPAPTIPASPHNVTLLVRDGSLKVMALEPNGGTWATPPTVTLSKEGAVDRVNVLDPTSGQYKFTNVNSGNYTVTITVPYGYELSGQTNTQTQTVSYDNSSPEIDFTFVKVTVPSLQLSQSLDKDGYLVGDTAAVTVKATADKGNITGNAKIENGLFSISNGYDTNKLSAREGDWNIGNFNFSPTPDVPSNQTVYHFTVVGSQGTSATASTNYTVQGTYSYKITQGNGSDSPRRTYDLTIPVKDGQIVVRAPEPRGETWGSAPTVTLQTDGAADVLGTLDTTTGLYTFSNLKSASYTVVISVPYGYELSSQTNSQTQTLSYDNNSPEMDFTFVKVNVPTLLFDQTLDRDGYLVGDTAAVTVKATADKGNITGNAKIENGLFSISNGYDTNKLSAREGDWSIGNFNFTPTPDVPSNQTVYHFTVVGSQGTSATASTNYTVQGTYSYKITQGNGSDTPSGTYDLTIPVKAGQIVVRAPEPNGGAWASAPSVTLKNDEVADVKGTLDIATGLYTFSNLKSGSYTVVISVPYGYELSSQTDSQTQTLSYDNNSPEVDFTFRKVDVPTLRFAPTLDKNGYLVGDTAVATITATANGGSITEDAKIENGKFSITDYDSTKLSTEQGDWNLPTINFIKKSPTDAYSTPSISSDSTKYQFKILPNNQVLTSASTNYTITANSSYNLTTKHGNAAPDDPHTITIPVKAGAITVRIRTADSSSLDFTQNFNAQVTLTKPDNSTDPQYVDMSTGEYTYTNLTTGNYNVAITLPPSYTIQNNGSNSKTVALSYDNNAPVEEFIVVKKSAIVYHGLYTGNSVENKTSIALNKNQAVDMAVEFHTYGYNPTINLNVDSAFANQNINIRVKELSKVGDNVVATDKTVSITKTNNNYSISLPRDDVYEKHYLIIYTVSLGSNTSYTNSASVDNVPANCEIDTNSTPGGNPDGGGNLPLLY